MIRARLWLLATVLLLIAAAATIWWQFSTDLAAAKDKAALGSTVINTPCGLIEYQQAGTARPCLPSMAAAAALIREWPLPRP